MPVVVEGPLNAGVAVIEVCELKAFEGVVVDDILGLDVDGRLTGTAAFSIIVCPVWRV